MPNASPPVSPPSDAQCAAAFPALRTVAWLWLAAVLGVSACVLWVDRAAAWWAWQHGWPTHTGLRVLTRLPEVLSGAAVLLLLATPLRLGWRRSLHAAERCLLAMSVAVAIAQTLKGALKIAFGRAWPLTWTGGNLSLIHDHFYAFLGWQTDRRYQSFPSGHSTVVFAAMTVLWLAAPRLRWLAVVACTVTLAGLLALDYHFVGDMLGGAWLGLLCGLYTWRTAQRLQVGAAGSQG